MAGDRPKWLVSGLLPGQPQHTSFPGAWGCASNQPHPRELSVYQALPVCWAFPYTMCLVGASTLLTMVWVFERKKLRLRDVK